MGGAYIAVDECDPKWLYAATWRGKLTVTLTLWYYYPQTQAFALFVKVRGQFLTSLYLVLSISTMSCKILQIACNFWQKIFPSTQIAQPLEVTRSSRFGSRLTLLFLMILNYPFLQI